MTNWNIIKEWASLRPEIKLQVTLAIIILALAGVVVYYEKKLSDKEIEMNRRISEETQKTLKAYMDHIRYVEANEKQYKDIVLDVNKLKGSK
jgi:uncharacterized protein YneF (UPF0154 family)